MPEAVQVVLMTLVAGAAIPLGGLLASVERIQPRWLEEEVRHGVIAFGGGVLLSAVALVLVPEGTGDLGLGAITAAMASGGLVFCWLDARLAKAQTPASQLVATLADFLPEAIALGSVVAGARETALLLTVLILLQNLPEGFNAFRELTARGGLARRRVLAVFAVLVPLGPVAGLAGHWWLTAWPAAVDAIMLFAAGGILYLTFQDIAPQAQLKWHWAPPLGAVGGFLLGLVGHIVIGG